MWHVSHNLISFFSGFLIIFHVTQFVESSVILNCQLLTWVKWKAICSVFLVCFCLVLFVLAFLPSVHSGGRYTSYYWLLFTSPLFSDNEKAQGVSILLAFPFECVCSLYVSLSLSHTHTHKPIYVSNPSLSTVCHVFKSATLTQNKETRVKSFCIT